jgi:AraC family transcriptional regulator
MPTTTPLEEMVAKQFRVERAPTLLAQNDASEPIVFSRLRAEGAFRGTTMPGRPDKVFAFQVALLPMKPGDIWIDNRHSKLQVAAVGDTFVFDLTSPPIANLPPPFDFMRFYMPVNTLEQLAFERGLRRVGALKTNSVGLPDPVMRGLAMSLLPAMTDPAACSALFLDAVGLAFHAHIVHKYAGSMDAGTVTRSGLAPWQLQRVDTYIDAHLSADPTITELARECRLSASHFARAFTQSTGMPPHRWLMRRRVERAKELLIAGKLDIAQIALACGFVDQSHLNRVFKRFDLCGPGKWRRQRWNG